MKTSTIALRSRKKGFTLVEIVIVSILLGIFTVLTAGFIRDAAATGRANVLAKNAQEINNVVNDLRAAGATFNNAAASYSFTQGTSNTGAVLNFKATTAPADVAAFIADISGSGILSFGHTAALTKSITAASYTYTIANGVPVFAGTAGATP